jgi:hypothetical protein
LQKYRELLARINAASNPERVRAELAYLLNNFDPGNLFSVEQAKEHSMSLLEEWLPRHKFKSWKRTEKRRKRVTPTMRKERAKEIAEILADPERWHSHGRGIGLKYLISDEIKLKIKNFGDDEELNQKIGNYYHLFSDYCVKIGSGSSDSPVLHSRNGMRRL